jgi:hypothetical protein
MEGKKKSPLFLELPEDYKMSKLNIYNSHIEERVYVTDISVVYS